MLLAMPVRGGLCRPEEGERMIEQLVLRTFFLLLVILIGVVLTGRGRLSLGSSEQVQGSGASSSAGADHE
jgi:hypothetical protein